MENLAKAIQSFNELIENTEKAAFTKKQSNNSNRINPPAPAPPPTPALPSITDFNMVALLGLHDTEEDNTIKAKVEELKTVLRKSIAILNGYAELLASKNRTSKTDEKVWQMMDYFPLLEKVRNEQITSISKTAKGSDLAAEIINAIKSFKPAEDKELIRFSEYLGKIARSIKQKKRYESPFDNNSNNLIALTYTVDVIKNGATTDYRQNIKLLSVEFGNDLSDVRCDGNREINVNITISHTDYTLNYVMANQRDKEIFHDFLNTKQVSFPENDPAFFEGYFKRP